MHEGIGEIGYLPVNEKNGVPVDAPEKQRYTVLMLQTIVLSLLAGLAGLWVATEFIPGVDFTGDLKNFLIAGLVLGVVIAVIRPILNLFSVILKLIVLLVLVLVVVWVLDIFFPELNILNVTSLLWTGLAVTGATVILSLFGRGKV